MATVEFKVRESVAHIELSRPEALNAISSELARELVAVTATVAADSNIHAVVLTAAGDRAFCVGADLKERNAMSDADFRAQRTLFRAAFGGVLNLPQPTVAGSSEHDRVNIAIGRNRCGDGDQLARQLGGDGVERLGS